MQFENTPIYAFVSNLRKASKGGRIPPEMTLPDRVGGCTAVFWWDDNTPLLEFQLLASDGGPSGYAIVSTSKKLPPILEFAFKGNPLSVSLNLFLNHHWLLRGDFRRKPTYYYFSSLDVTARVESQEPEKDVFIAFPELYELAVPSDHVIRRNPADYWDPAELENRWKSLKSYSDSGAKKIVTMLEDQKPVAYQQNCKELKTSDKNSGHYCDPQCIAGCANVGWAMFAASRKRGGQGGAADAIWPGSTCWNIDWPSWASPVEDPSQCSEVSSTIWIFHDLMNTTCDGITNEGMWKHAENYFRTEWGRNWNWKEEWDVPFDNTQRLMDERKTYVFGARGPWTDYVEAHLDEYASKSGFKGKAGHVTVGWGGMPSPMVGGPKILLSLGWGTGFGDNGSKWVDFAQFKDNKIAYVKKY